jgi:hypothetical protein
VGLSMDLLASSSTVPMATFYGAMLDWKVSTDQGPGQ